MKDKLRKIEEIIKKKEFLKNKKALLNFFREKRLQEYFFSKILIKLDNLLEIKFILDILIKNKDFFLLNKILELNINSNNNYFIINYIKKNFSSFKYSKLGDSDLFQAELIRILSLISKDDLEITEVVFETLNSIIKSLSEQDKDNLFEGGQVQGYITDILSNMLNRGYSNQKIVDFLFDNFKLVDYDILFNNSNIFLKIIKEYLIIDFKGNLDFVKQKVVQQYDKLYGEEFKGWEWSDPGVSFFGSNYSLRDFNIVEQVFKPGVNKFYKDTGDFDFIKENIIFTESEVSREKPDFLTRSSLDILLERYRNKDNKISSEVFIILKSLILGNGAPSKAELIYQAINRNFEDYTIDQIWSLVSIHAEKYDLPTSVFLDNLVIKLDLNGHKKAHTKLNIWQDNLKYYNGFVGGRTLDQALLEALPDNFDVTVNKFKDFIGRPGFRDGGSDLFRVHELSKVLSRILEINIDIGLEILNSLDYSKGITANEQVLFLNSITGINVKELDDKEVDILLSRIYDDYILKILEASDFSISNIDKVFTESNVREQFVKFAEFLADNKKITEAIEIVRVFIDDKDPFLPKDDTGDLDFNEHNKISNGEEVLSITSVRGWCAWVLMKCITVEGRGHIDEIIDLIKQLVDDPNHYVKHMSCYALGRLVDLRLRHLDDSKTMYLDDNKEEALNKAKSIEKMAFGLLESISSYESNVQEVLIKSVLMVFNHIRALNDNEAFILLSLIKDKFSDKAIAEAIPLFIFFAEFRETLYQDWKWKTEGLYDDLKNFNSRPYKEMIDEFINSDSKEILEQLSFKFSVLPKESPIKIERCLEYLEKIVDQGYSPDIYRSIYVHFIEKNIPTSLDILYPFWKKCLVNEINGLHQLVEKNEPGTVPNWVDFSHDRILEIVKDELGEEAFLDSLELFIQFPEGVNLSGIHRSISLLKNFPVHNNRIKKIYNLLIDRNPHYQEEMNSWLGQ